MSKVIDRLIVACKTYQSAKAFAAAVEAVELAKIYLDEAYRNWKEQNQVADFVGRDSDTWKAMMLATEGQYRALVNAKARKRRAEKKLLQAVEG